MTLSAGSRPSRRFSRAAGTMAMNLGRSWRLRTSGTELLDLLLVYNMVNRGKRR